MQLANEAELFVSATFATHAATWNKLLSGEPLADGEEYRTAIVLYNMSMIEAENRHQQFNAGYLSVESWEGTYASLQGMVNLPIYSDWRDTPGAIQHSADFLKLTDGLAENSTSK